MRGRKITWQKVLLASVLSISAIWLLSLIWGLAGKAHVAWQQAHETKTGYETLEARRIKLENDLNALHTSRGQDAAVREAFGVAKSGEEVIVVVPEKGTTTPESSSWWQSVLDWF